MKYFSALLSTLTLSIMFMSAQAIYYGNGAHGSQHFVTSANGHVKAVNPHASSNGMVEEMAIAQEDQATMPAGEDQSGDTMYALGMVEEDQPTMSAGEDQSGETMYALDMVEEDAKTEEPSKAKNGWAGLFGGAEKRQARRAGRQERRVGRRGGRQDRREARRAGRHGVSPMYIDELDDVEQPQ